MNKELKDLTEVEIKSIIYDESIIVNRSTNNIRILEDELAKRKAPPPNVE